MSLEREARKIPNPRAPESSEAAGSATDLLAALKANLALLEGLQGRLAWNLRELEGAIRQATGERR